jgi:hypothetical protein
MQSKLPVPEEKPRPVVLGMHFDAVTVPQALDRFFELATMPPGPRVCRIAATVNVDFIVNTYCATKSTPRNPPLARVLRRAELVIADGMPLKDYPDIHSEILKEIYLFFFTGTFFVVMGRAGKLRKRFLAGITGRSLEEADRILYTKASWKNQDRCLIGKKTDFSVFRNTDMHIWYGLKGTVDRKLSAGLDGLKAKGYPFTCKFFEEMGHGGLVGENTELFIKEVEKVHRQSV